MIALVAGVASAALVNVDLCLEFQVDYVDPYGDFWTDNSNRPGRGVEVDIVDDSSTRTVNMGTDGCKNLNVDVSGANQHFQVTARSKADIKGVKIESHFTDEDPDIAVDVWGDRFDFATSTWLTVSALNTPIIKELPLDTRWEGLAAATWMFNRSDFDMADGPSRRCCLEADANYNEDGTCAGGVGNPVNDYFVNTWNGKIHMFFNTNLDRGQCPGGGGNGLNGFPGAIQYLSLCPNKNLIAHELGHAIVGVRIGALEEYVDLTAPLDGCMGDYWWWGGPTDTEPGGGRAVFTKEYLSQATREGWGEFIAAWAWNSRLDADCVVRAREYYTDFDLDGVVDNDFGALDPYGDFEYDCAGTPYVDPDPLGIVMDGENWLEDLIAAPDAAGCERAAGVLDPDVNRSTAYDVSKFFWALTSDPVNRIPPEDLADLYVDTCPRGWSLNDQEWPLSPDELVTRRIELSATAQGATATQITDAWDAHVDH